MFWKIASGAVLATILLVTSAVLIWRVRRTDEHVAELTSRLAVLSKQSEDGAALRRVQPAAFENLVRSTVAAANAAPSAAATVALAPVAPGSSAYPGFVPSSKTRAEIRDEIQTAYESDRADVHWETSSRRDIQRALADAMPEGSSLGSVDCHTEMCRVESTHRNVQEFNQFVKVAFMDSHPIIPLVARFSARMDGPDGEGLHFVSYVSRNSPLPITP